MHSSVSRSDRWLLVSDTKVKTKIMGEARVDKSICDKPIERLYRQYSKELLAYTIRQFKCGQADAEDVVQQAFVRLSQVDIQSIEIPRVYLYRAVHNIAIDVYRKGKHLEPVPDEEREEPADELCPERITDSRQRLKILADTIEKMPEARRKFLLMNRFDNLSFAEISRRVGLSESMVRKHVKKALEDCQAGLKRLSRGDR